RAGDRTQQGAAGPLRRVPREPQRLLQPHGRSRQGARLRAPGPPARPEVRPRLLPAGEGAGAPGAPHRGRRLAEPGHRAQPARVRALLRPRRALPPARQDRREPEGPRLLQAPGARDERAREDAPRAPESMTRTSRRAFLQMAGGALGAVLLPRRAGARSLAVEAPGRILFTDVTAAAGLLHATNVSGSPEDKQLILEEMGGGAAFFDYDNDGWLDIFLVNGTSLDP